MNSDRLLEQLALGKILLSDGAMGTMLHRHGLRAGECPEARCLSHPETVREIHDAYVSAGCDIVETNTFGANALKLAHYGMAASVTEINRAAVSLTRAAAGAGRFVAGSIGPTGKILAAEGGDASDHEMATAFYEQALALAGAGADLLLIETMSSLPEALIAVASAKKAAMLPVACTFTFQSTRRGFRTMMGVAPERAAKDVAAAGAAIIGANCGAGIADMIEIARQMRAACPALPLLIQPNAGLPSVEEGVTVFREKPNDMASRIDDLITAGANIVGGCCGTTPEHIAAISAVVRGREVLG